MDNETAKARFRALLKLWIDQQIEAEHYTCIMDACQSLAVNDLGLKSSISVRHYLYGIRFPVSAKHVPKLCKRTGIKPEIANPEAYG